MESETRKHISIVLIAVMVSSVFAAFSLFALPNTQAFIPEPPACAPPNITSFAPLSPVNDTVGNWRPFNVTVNQTVNVSWYLDDSLLYTNDTINEANYTLRAVTVGEHNVSASAENPCDGTDMQTWIWNVTAPPACAPPNITSFAPPSPVNDTVGNWKTFNVTVNQTVNVSWYLDDSLLYTNDTINEANYTLRALTVGEHNVSASAENPCDGTDMQTWIWNVTAPPCCYCGDICVNINGWWRCGGAFNLNDTPIQAAVDNATEGETICVMDGTYKENVDVDKRLTIKSQNGSDNCTVTALTSSDHVFNVTEDYVNITGFTVTGASGGYAGISLNGVEHCTISNNNVTYNSYGIHLSASNNNTLTDNIALNNGKMVTSPTSSENNILTDTIVGASSGMGAGIYLGGSNNNTLTGNTASDNDVCGLFLGGSNNNTLTSNIASNNGMVDIPPPMPGNTILTDTLAGRSSGMGTGIFLGGSNNNTLTDNNASDNDLCGIYLVESENNTLADNIASNHWIYILLGGSEDTILTDTIVGQGSGMGAGIYLGGSNNNTLSENIVSNNTYGIHLIDSSDNTISDNTASVNGVGILVGYIPSVTSVGSGNELGNGDLSGSNNNTISGNTVSVNTVGISLVGGNKYLNNVGSGNELGNGDLSGANNNILTGNTVSGNGDGIVLRWSDYNTISDNFVKYNVHDGIYLSGSDNNNLTDNDASNNVVDGIVLVESDNNNLTGNSASWNNMVGILLVGSGDFRSFASGTELGGSYLDGSNNNVLTGNLALSNTAYDFYSNEYAHDNRVDELWINIYPTQISFTYDNGVGIKGVTAPHPNPADKENIGKYVNATNVTETSSVSLKVHYIDADVTGVEEDSLRLYHWNGTVWGYITGSGVNTGDNYVYGLVTSFCQIAPFGDPAPTPKPPGGGGGGFKGSRDWDGDGYTDVEEALNGTDWHDPCDPDPYCDACPNKPTPPPTSTETPNPPPKQASVPPPVETPTPPTPEPPGFNVLYAILAIFGIAGLAGGAYYVFVLKPQP